LTNRIILHTVFIVNR
jgi:cysteine synthase